MEALTNFPDDMRERMAQTFRFGNASYLYCYEQNSDPTKEDYQEWLTGLADNIRVSEMEREHQACMSSLPLRRFSLERRDFGMAKHLKKVLNKQDWEAHQKISYGL